MLKVIKKRETAPFHCNTQIKSVRTELQQRLSLIICSTFELLHCWILQKIVQEWMLRHLAKSFTTAWQLYNSIFKETLGNPKEP